jgi:hypothetical protein
MSVTPAANHTRTLGFSKQPDCAGGAPLCLKILAARVGVPSEMWLEMG